MRKGYQWFRGDKVVASYLFKDNGLRIAEDCTYDEELEFRRWLYSMGQKIDYVKDYRK